ncbi:MAG: hypothetical protein AAF939_21980, partial [Planctomycetota bacterium]
MSDSQLPLGVHNESSKKPGRPTPNTLVLAKHLFTGLLNELPTKIEFSLALAGSLIHGESLRSMLIS